MLDKEIVPLDTPWNSEGVEARLSSLDVLVDGLPPDGLAARGLDPDRLSKDHPGLVILHLSHFGQDGPYRDWAGGSLIDFALGGSLIRCGRATEAPLPPPAEIGDSIGGITGVLATLAVVAERSRADSGGDRIDCSISEACLATSDWSIPIRSLMGTTTPRNGAGPLYPVYRVKDGFVRVLNLSPKQWRAFMTWIGKPPELAAAEWESLPYRAANPETIDLVFEREFGHRTREELYHEGQRAGVSVVPVYAPEDIAGDAHFSERRTLAKVDFPGLGKISVPRSFVRLGRGSIPADPEPPSERTAIPAPQERERLAPGLDFSKLRVVEIGSGGVAPEASRHLALFGADVVKVEHLSAPDVLRTTGGPGMHEYTGSWASSNRNKRSVEIDLKTPEGRSQIFELLSQADVFFENNSGGVCDRLGIGYEAVSAANPRIIYCSSQIFGATGKASAYSGFGPSNHAASGLAHLWSAPDNPKPEGNQLVHPDHLAGKMLAIAAIAALIDRQRSGLGNFVDLGQAEFAMATIGEIFVEASLAGKAARRGQNHPSFAPHGVFATLLPDEWVAISVETDEQWNGLKRVLGDPDWAQNPQLAEAGGRLAQRERLAQGVSSWTTTKARPFIVNALQREGVPAMQLLHPVEQLADPHLNARGAFETLVHPLAGIGRFEGLPFHFKQRPKPTGERAPLLGEQTAAVLSDWLG
jgi:crotonobetainyl-CoA:carnitine CoA-transferase CaiB-like acyl-CoA transferase